MPIKYFLAAAAGAAIGLLFVFTSGIFAETAMRWLMALLALIAGAKLGIFVCYISDLLHHGYDGERRTGSPATAQMTHRNTRRSRT